MRLVVPRNLHVRNALWRNTVLCRITRRDLRQDHGPQSNNLISCYSFSICRCFVKTLVKELRALCFVFVVNLQSPCSPVLFLDNGTMWELALLSAKGSGSQ